MSKRGQNVNYGIIGKVTAKAVAVGEGASANVTEAGAQISRAEFDEAIRILRAQIDAMQLPAAAREIVTGDLKKIEEAGAKDKPAESLTASTLLSGLIDKLKLVGVLLNTTAGLQEPIKKLAAWFQVPMPF